MFEDLKLNSEMKTSHLIQRLHKPSYFVVKGEKVDNPFSFGGGFANGGISKEIMSELREVCSFDYMGSAEFEFGAVPSAIKFLAVQSVNKNLVYGEVESVFYVCPTQYKTEVKSRIKLLKSGKAKWYMKGHCGLSNYFASDASEYAKKNVGWLELDNGYAFFVDKEMFEKFKEFLGKFEA